MSELIVNYTSAVEVERALNSTKVAVLHIKKLFRSILINPNRIHFKSLALSISSCLIYGRNQDAIYTIICICYGCLRFQRGNLVSFEIASATWRNKDDDAQNSITLNSHNCKLSYVVINISYMKTCQGQRDTEEEREFNLIKL